jgi:hypothetical protein
MFVLLLCGILLFGPRRSHSSVPARTKVRPARAAAVKHGPLGPPEGLVLDGREHDGRLVCADGTRTIPKTQAEARIAATGEPPRRATREAGNPPASRFDLTCDYSPICASMGGHLSFHGAAAS